MREVLGDKLNQSGMEFPGEHVLRQFGIFDPVVNLEGGSAGTYRAGDIVLRHIVPTSFGNNHSFELLPYIADFLHDLTPSGFRVSKPVPTAEGEWMTKDGWTAWDYLEGVQSTKENITQVIESTIRFLDSLSNVKKSPFMDTNTTPSGKADSLCWRDRPTDIHPVIRPLVKAMYDLKKPVRGLRHQLVHADLNPENILIEPGMAPGFLDIAPFWRPPEFALAIFANFIGPRRGDISCLSAFADVNEFDQLLLRAGIRMLLILPEAGKVADWEKCPEKRAAELILEYLR